VERPALKAWRGGQENVIAAQQAFSHRAKCDSAAALGRYTTSMETESVVA
jgi:fructose-bisphosphate aldolase, class I